MLPIRIIYQFTDTGEDCLLLHQISPFTKEANIIVVSEGAPDQVNKDAEIYSEILGVEIEREGPLHDAN